MTDKRSKPFGGKIGIFLGGILLVAAVIAFVSLDGYPPKDSESVGAIGAAKRYHADQITESDVQLQDAEMVALLQNDEVQKLIQDKDFQLAVKNQNWTALMSNDYYRRVFFDKQFLSLMVETDLSTKLRQQQYLSLQPEEAYKVFLEQLEDVEQNARGPRLSEIVADPAFKNVFLKSELARTIFLDDNLIRQMVEGDVVGAIHPVDARTARPPVYTAATADADFARVTKVYLDEHVAGTNPRLPKLALDAEFEKLFKNQELIRRVTMDAAFAHKLLDARLMTHVKKTELLQVRPEVAYETYLAAVRDAEMARPASRVQDMATDAEFIKFFDQKLAREIVMDEDFFRPLLEAGLAGRLAELKYADIRPEEKYNSFLQKLNEANLGGSAAHTLAVAQDAEFAKFFKASSLMQKIVLDADYARQLIELGMISKWNKTEFVTVRPEVAYQTFLTRANDAALAGPNRRLPDYAADAEFKQLFENQKMASTVILDLDFMRQKLDAGLISRFNEIKYKDLRPEVTLQQVQAAVADAQLAGRPSKIADLVNDAAFQKVFLENGMMRQIVLDEEFARWMLDSEMYSRLKENNLVDLRPEVAYNKFAEMANEAQLVQRNARMASWAADAEFKSMFETQKLASTMVLDASMLQLMIDADFATLAGRADTRTIMSDASYLDKYLKSE